MTPDPPSLACPTCDYDLRGTFDGVETFTCPECGRRTSIPTLAARAVTDARERRRMWVLAGAALLVFTVVALGRANLSFDRLGFWDLLFAAIAALLGWCFSTRWNEMPARTRLIYALTPAIGLLLLDLVQDHAWMRAFILFALLCWYYGFEIYEIILYHRGPFKR